MKINPSVPLLLDGRQVKDGDHAALILNQAPLVPITQDPVNPFPTSTDQGVRSFLSEDRVSEIVPLIEGIIERETMPKWKRALKKLEGNSQPWCCPGGFGY